VLLPGPCIAQAAADASARALAAGEAEGRALAAEAAAAASDASGSASGLFAGFGDSIVGAIHEGAAPIESTASATRYAAVATTIIVVALVLLGLVLAFKVL
jgi:hypothetical protein